MTKRHSNAKVLCPGLYPEDFDVALLEGLVITPVGTVVDYGKICDDVKMIDPTKFKNPMKNPFQKLNADFEDSSLFHS